MLVDSLKYSALNLKKTILDNLVTVFFFLFFTVLMDLIREQISSTAQGAQVILGIVDILGSSLFYALFLNSILEITKFSTLNFFTYLRVNILYSIFFFVGTVLLVLPGLYILTIFFFAPVMALEGKVHSDYFKQSRLLAKKSPWSIFGLSVIALLLMAFDFWFMGLLQAEVMSESLRYSLLLASNILVVIVNIYLFIATVFLYRKFQE
ncbi:hypothetical protein [Halobacteriovorax sp. JY17]|uniref:hypothetical protein n=1 Tax=Halobacteriovorax sp. JY17 TaxID=2014617 RepID=UPI000C5A73B1|nr:hypothetical protein [Halobacteriovorax sp. JY17]PIK15313.1 MAG: hypothetical protein CES88_00960 [Halobacteriovorax sp. JY17]